MIWSPRHPSFTDEAQRVAAMPSAPISPLLVFLISPQQQCSDARLHCSRPVHRDLIYRATPGLGKEKIMIFFVATTFFSKR
jgi:hypothetical protein